MFKPVEPIKQRHYRPHGVGAYVRLTPRLFYISSEACKKWGEHERCIISIDAARKTMVITPVSIWTQEELKNLKPKTWKLSTVKGSDYAKRIETRNSTISFLEAGFPKGMLGKYLMCDVDLSGSLIVNLIPDYEKIEGLK